MSELERKTFVFDLDGTICEQTEGGDAYLTARPNPLMIDCVRKLHGLGHRIVINTARGMATIGKCFYPHSEAVDAIEGHYRESTEKWLRDNDVPFDELVFGKPSGDYYIDDKGMSIGYLIEMLGVA